jgi:hypothetical protein
MKTLALVLLILHFTAAPSIPLWACFLPLLAGAALYVGGLAIFAVLLGAVFKPFG